MLACHGWTPNELPPSWPYEVQPQRFEGGGWTFKFGFDEDEEEVAVDIDDGGGADEPEVWGENLLPIEATKERALFT